MTDAEHSVRYIGNREKEQASSLAHEDALRAAAAEAEHLRQIELNETIHRNREAARLEFNMSEQGANSAQIREAERVMRLDTYDTLDAIGSVLGDPTQGPSS